MTPSTDGLCSGGTSGQGKKKPGSKQANRWMCNYKLWGCFKDKE
jgi:hypothetical protein